MSKDAAGQAAVSEKSEVMFVCRYVGQLHHTQRFARFLTCVIGRINDKAERSARPILLMISQDTCNTIPCMDVSSLSMNDRRSSRRERSEVWAPSDIELMPGAPSHGCYFIRSWQCSIPRN